MSLRSSIAPAFDVRKYWEYKSNYFGTFSVKNQKHSCVLFAGVHANLSCSYISSVSVVQYFPVLQYIDHRSRSHQSK